ncbi:MAG: sugar phosphate isomerase/epimerase [Armatimonadetes bacterium]|nr:sugar phosphate isomerase/epimerase [Armatimonadota bacterium]
MEPKVILTGFADEGPPSKRAEAQLSMCRALGLSYYSPRFVDCGQGVKNLMALTPEEISFLKDLHDEYEMKVSSVGSPIGKVKLLDIDDGTHNRYVPFDQYLETEVAHAIELAETFGAKLIRGFSFYGPKQDDPRQHVAQAAEYLRAIAEKCAAAGIVFGLEVEANLVGRNGELEMALYEAVNHDHLLLIFDGANISCQGYGPEAVYQQYEAMKGGIGWMHVKDYLRHDEEGVKDYVDEEMMMRFVPADRGHAGYYQILADFKHRLPSLMEEHAQRGIPGVFLDLEPHLKGGGQFGGFSGPDGFGVALRALCRVLDAVGIGYDLTVYDELKKAGK